MISAAARLSVVNNHLISNCSLADLGSSIQRFLEAAKQLAMPTSCSVLTLFATTD